MRTIIVPTDFSAISFNAARYAAAIAEKLKATITLFHVFPTPLTFSEAPVPARVFDILQKDAEDLIEKSRAGLMQIAPPSVRINTYVRAGSFLTGLREFCDETSPYAVVLSPHGDAGLEHLLLGSDTYTAVKHLPWPLIVVPRGAKFKSPQRIALACDFKRVNTTVPGDAIRDMVHTFNAKLFVLHVHLSPGQSYADEAIEGTSDLMSMLADLHPSYHFIDSKDVSESILDFVENNDIDLLIGFPKKHNLLENMFHKSHSKAIARETPIPFITFHEK